MSDRTLHILLFIGVVLLFVVGLLFSVDYVQGESEYIETTIAAKIYIRAYTTHHTGYHTHKVGNATIRTPYRYSVYHPEQFRLMATSNQQHYNVTEAAWDRCKEGEPMVLGRRIGRWTGWPYWLNLVAVNPALEK